MASQFEKRKAKSIVDIVKSVVSAEGESVPDPVEVSAEASAPVYTQTGYDVYSSDGGKTYHVAQIEYNPETGEAKVTGTSDISRLVALKYANQKVALGILKTGTRGK